MLEISVHLHIIPWIAIFIQSINSITHQVQKVTGTALVLWQLIFQAIILLQQETDLN